jgi:hypothetical protein
MKKNIFILILLIESFLSFGQVALFKEYDFNKGGYRILGIKNDITPKGLEDTIGDFYTDDISVLNLLKKEWIFEKSISPCACGFHYSVYVCKNGIELESFGINLFYKVIETNKGTFYFDSKKLRKLKNRLKKPIVESNEFSAISEARNERKQKLTSQNLILIETPDWLEYEGEFSISYNCPTEIGDCLNNEKNILSQITDFLKKKFPNLKFELVCFGGSATDIYIKVKCDKKFADLFVFYPLIINEWKFYNLELISYKTIE